MSFTSEGMSFSDCDIVKFGGSSVATAEKIKNAARLVSEHVRKGKKTIVVVSAMGRTTDELMQLANSTGNVTPQHLDEILSMGERTSARVLTAALAAQGIKVDFVDIEKPEWPLITDGDFGDAKILLEETRPRVLRLLAERMHELDALVIPGFIGKTRKGEITTIGRGGSDTTAFVIADALNTKQVILVSDVSGIMSADPKLVDSPKRIDEIEVKKLVGLADSGLKFLHKKALSHKPRGTDVKLIGNQSRSLDAGGTIIRGSMKDVEIDIISADASAITIVGEGISSNPALLAEMLSAFKHEDGGILGMAANSDNLVFYVHSHASERVCKKLHSLVAENRETMGLALRSGLALIMINGISLQETPGSISRAATLLRDAGVNIFGQYTVMSEIFLMVKKDDGEKAVELLRKEFVRGEKNEKS